MAASEPVAAVNGQGQGFVAQYLPALLTQAAAQLSDPFSEEVRAAGLSVFEWRVLATLADTGRAPLGLLARRAATKQPTLTRLIERMVQRGLVLREDDPADRRQILLCITPLGQETVGRLIARAWAYQCEQRERYGQARWEQLVGLVRELLVDRG